MEFKSPPTIHDGMEKTIHDGFKVNICHSWWHIFNTRTHTCHSRWPVKDHSQWSEVYLCTNINIINEKCRSWWNTHCVFCIHYGKILCYIYKGVSRNNCHSKPTLKMSSLAAHAQHFSADLKTLCVSFIIISVKPYNHTLQKKEC